MCINVILTYFAKPWALTNFREQYFFLFIVLQFFHSIDEQVSGFPKKWPLIKITEAQFGSFEIIFQVVWFLPLLVPTFPSRDFMIWFFPLLMFVNGVQHLIWFAYISKTKEYIPGLITAPLFIFAFIKFYLEILGKI